MSSGSLRVKDQKELERLLRSQKEKKVRHCSSDPDELGKIKAKIIELETTNRNMMKRVFELETKIENLREANNVRQITDQREGL